MTLIDLFRQYHFAATSNKFPVSARVTYTTLLGVWNEARRPASLSISRKHVIELTALPRTTFNDALKYLTDRALIKTNSKSDNLLITFNPSDKWRLAVKVPSPPKGEVSNDTSVQRKEECAHARGDAVSFKTINEMYERGAQGTKYDGMTLQEMLEVRRAEREREQREREDKRIE